jgi:hypothetical protein
MEPRPCERRCERCGNWKHHSRFAQFRNSTVSKNYFHKLCRDCEQIERNEKKNADRPLAIIKGRAATAAHDAGASTDFFMVQMNYRGLIEDFRIRLEDNAVCCGCGHGFMNERDIQIDHILPPRHAQDWARLHTRNLRLFCASCNRAKGKKSFSQWLDDQELARLSNLASKDSPTQEAFRGTERYSSGDTQLGLFSV